MNRTLLATLLLCLGTSISASELDLTSQSVLRQLRQQRNGVVAIATTKATPLAVEAKSQTVVTLTRLAAGATEYDLETEGVDVLCRRGDICVCAVDIDDVERIASLDCVKHLQLSRQLRPMLDQARAAVGVDNIQAGIDLPQAYTGKGVITGIVDSGVDPSHINFKDSDGNIRIKQLSWIRANAAGTAPITTQYTNNSDDINQISSFKTDDTSSYHGTHTMGIMAGSYRGNLDYAVKTGEHECEVKTNQPNPFYGIAYDSDIVASCGTMGDGYIAYGVQDILWYAEDHNQPCVINLSLGSNSGAHDGKDNMCEFLTLAGKEAIICVSAGNEGNYPVAIEKTFTDTDTSVKTFIHNFYFTSGTYEGLIYGGQYIYSQDESALDVQFVIYSKSRNRIAQRFTLPATPTGNATYYISSTDYQQSSTDVESQALAKYFDGYMGIGSGYDSNTGRFYAMIDTYLFPKDDNYLVGIVVNGKAGQHANLYSDAVGTYYTSYDISGWTDGSCNGSINSMACGDNIIVVGSYNTRDDWGSLDGVVRGYADTYTPGEISSYSSYGTLSDGRNLPHVCAPGASVISSASRYYIEPVLSAGSLTEGALQARQTSDTRTNYWITSAGTSMATPVVAGAIALWLEADPTLTVDDVKDIISTTSIKDDYVTGYTGDPVKWGAGKFDAYAGLKEVVRRSASVGSVNVDEKRLMIKALGDNRFNIFLSGEPIDVNVYAVSGALVATKHASDGELDLDLDALSRGIYIISVNGTNNERVAIR